MVSLGASLRTDIEAHRWLGGSNTVTAISDSKKGEKIVALLEGDIKVETLKRCSKRGEDTSTIYPL